MSNYIASDTDLTAVADAIREKGGTSAALEWPDEFVDAIEAITTGDKLPHTDIPDYVKSEALAVAERVRNHQSSGCLTFLAGSDAHQLTAAENATSGPNITAGNLHAGMGMKVLAHALTLDFAAFLGDYTWGAAPSSGTPGTTIENGTLHIQTVTDDIDDAFRGLPNFRTVGNHDGLGPAYAQNNGSLSNEQLYSMIGKYNNDGVTVMGSTTSGYCYRDFATQKIRIICLNTAEGDTHGRNPPQGTGEYVSDAQKLWFAQTLADVGSRTGWSFIILSHHPLDWGYIISTSAILKAYIDGGSYQTVNFSGSNKAKCIANIHGHVHNFSVANLNVLGANDTGIPYDAKRISIPNMCFNRNNEYGRNSGAEYHNIEYGEDTTYNKVAGTAQDTAFCVVTIDPTAQKVFATCYGSGYDRTIGYSGVEYWNVSFSASHCTITGDDAVERGEAYTATVAANTGYDISSVVVTMSGIVVSGAYDDTTGIISIPAVTGNIAITAVAVKHTSYTNLVPTSLAPDGTVFNNGLGYKNGVRMSSSGPSSDSNSANAVSTGFMAYAIPATGLPGTIYIKGVTLQDVSNQRLYFSKDRQSYIRLYLEGNYTTGANALSTYYTVETLGTQYYRLTPKPSGDSSVLAKQSVGGDATTTAQYMRWSFVGTGENLVVTVNQEIDD